MIAQIITARNKDIIIKPIHDSIDSFELWDMMYYAGFDNMVVVNMDSYEDAVRLYNNIPGLQHDI